MATRELSIVVSICWSCVAAMLNLAAHAGPLRTVALSGQQAPGAPSGWIFSEFEDEPIVNDSGQIALGACLDGSGVSCNNNQGIWSERLGSLALVARIGSHAPGTPDGINFGSFLAHPGLNMNDQGQLAFGGILVGSGVDDSNDFGWYSEGSGNLALVARTGSQAPDTPTGVNFKVPPYSKPQLNNAGMSVFIAELTGSGIIGTNQRGIWTEHFGTYSLIARTGDQAPGTQGGVRFSQLGGPVLNNGGAIAFGGELTGSGVSSSNQSGIWSNRSGTLELVVRTGVGQQAPGTQSGVVFSEIPNFPAVPVINNDGGITFTAFVSGSGVSASNRQGIWSDGSGSLKLVARSGSHAPGTPSGVNFSQFESNSYRLNDTGKTAFYGTLIGSGVNSKNAEGIWSEGFGSLTLVARAGSQAAGTPSGVLYSLWGSLALNSAGQTAFNASVTGSGVEGTNNNGIWATDLSGIVRLIVRTGDVLEVDSGDYRTVKQLNFDGRGKGFNNRGQVVFRAGFTDGSSGIFVSNLVAIPEPASIYLATVTLSFFLMRVKKGRGSELYV